MTARSRPPMASFLPHERVARHIPARVLRELSRADGRRRRARGLLCVSPVGVFTVIRGQSFAGHAFADITSTGGSASVVVGVNPLVGFAAMGLLGAGAL